MRLRRLIKWLAILLLVLAAGLAAFLLTFDLSDYRERLEATASTLLGRAVTIEGPLSLGISLYPTVVIEGIRVANPDWASRQDLLHVKAIEAQVSVLPLLRGRVEIPHVLVDGVDLLLEQGPDGATNWAFPGLADSRAASVDSGAAIAFVPDVLMMSARDSTVAYRSLGSDAIHEVVLTQAEGVLGAHQQIQLSAQVRVRDVPITAQFTGGTVHELFAQAAPWPVETSLTVAGASIRATGTVSEPLGAPAVDLHVQVNGERLDTFSALVGEDLPPLGPYGLDSRVTIAQHELKMTDLRVRVGRTEFVGTIDASLRDPLKELRVALSSKVFYYEDFTAGEGATMTLPGFLAVEAFEIPADILREMDVEVSLSSEDVFMGEIALGPSNVGLRVQHGLFQLNYSREDFFGGSVFSLLQLDVRGEEPLATAHTMARSVDYGLALEALGVTDQIRVKTDTVLQFEGRGATMGKVLERGKFQLRAGPTTVFLHDPTGGDLVEIEISKVAASVAAGDHVAFAVAGRFRNEPFAINLRGGTLRSLFEGHEQWPIKLSARAVNASLAAKGHMGPWRDGISYSLALGVKGGVITAIDPDLPAFGPYAVAMALDGGLDHVAISRLAARLGQTRINGALDVDLKGTRPRIQGSLVSPRLRLEDVVKTTKTPLPVEALRAFDVDVAIRAQRVVVGPVVLADVTAEARFEQGVLRFSPIQGKVPDREGSPADLQASFELDVVQVPPVLSIEAQAKNLNYGRILRSMKVTNRIQGAGDFEVGLTSQAMKIETMVTRSTINVQTNNMRMAVGVGHGTEPRRLRISDATVSTIKGGPLQVTVTGTIQDTPFSLKSTGGTVKGFLAQTGRWPVGLTGRVGNALAVMEGHLNLPFDGENFTFQMALNGDRLSDLDPLVGQSFPKWGPFGATGTLVETKDGYDVTGLKGQIAGGDVSGSVSIGTKGLRPRVVADLTSEKMLLPTGETGEPDSGKPEAEDADQDEPGFMETFLPFVGAEEEGEEGAPSDDARVIPDYTLQVEVLRSVDLDIGWRVKDLDLPPHDVGDIAFRVRLDAGHLLVKPFTGRLWGGAVDGSLEVDAEAHIPVVHFQTTIEDLDYGSLLETMEVTDLVTGCSDRIHIDLKGRGSTLREVLGEADGRVEVVAGALELKSNLIDLWAADLIVTALTTAWEEEEEEVRKINCAVSNFDVEDGLARSDEILMDAPRLTVVGNGTINLDTEEIDVVLKPRPKDPSLVNLARPVRISGPLAEPEVSAQKTDIYGSAGWTVAGVVVPILLPIALTQVAGTTMGTGDENLCEAALAGKLDTSDKPDKKVARDQDKGPGKGADQNAEGLDYDNYDDMF